MDLSLPSLIRRRLNALCGNVKQRLCRWTKPDNQSLALNIVLDLTWSRSELVLENALLRQQLIVLQRHSKRPALTRRDRTLFVFIVSKLPTWKTALMIVQPDTLLRWHRDMFRRMWRRKSKRKGKKGREASAEVIGLGSRRLLHFGLTRSPNGAWVALQLREATPFGQGPRFLIRDNDNRFGGAFDRVADGTEIEVLTALYQAPKANAICERFPGSVRRECLDYFLILSERHL